jgi:DNA-binding IclR family transcriptional regulator
MEVKQAITVLRLIEFFAEHRQPASLAEIARQFGWPRSSTFNLLGTLSSQGYLYEPHERGRYYPSPKWMTLVQEFEQAQPIPAHLHGLLGKLADRSGETAVLGAVSGHHAIFIAVVESEHAVRYTASVGKLVPIQATATGRALLSQMSAAERAALLKRVQFERYTDSTLMNAAAIERLIAQSVKRGWFEGVAEYTTDLGGVAYPLHHPARHLAVMVGGPMQRIKPRYAEIAAMMRKEIDKLPAR